MTDTTADRIEGAVAGWFLGMVTAAAIGLGILGLTDITASDNKIDYTTIQVAEMECWVLTVDGVPHEFDPIIGCQPVGR